MESCAKCGKELAWHEQKMAFWNKHLKKGYIKWYVIGSRDMGKRKEFPQFTGKKLCQVCAYEVFLGPTTQSEQSPTLSNQTKIPQADIDIVDFAALNVFLKENGVVMSTFSCLKCSNMIEIPENGKILICKYCGYPIKPADVYEKVRALTE
jgi:DNA-directed RNA polymerase subunit RPC12/RpoP